MQPITQIGEYTRSSRRPLYGWGLPLTSSMLLLGTSNTTLRYSFSFLFCIPLHTRSYCLSQSSLRLVYTSFSILLPFCFPRFVVIRVVDL
jgi:hypothetical protein